VSARYIIGHTPCTPALVQNSLVLDITTRLAETQPDWDVTVARLKERPKYHAGKIQPGAFPGLLAEDHIRVSLERICGTMSAVTFNPIPDGARAEPYEFHYREQGHELVAQRGDQIVSEYDALLVADGLPVVFEVRSGRYWGGPNPLSGIANALLPTSFSSKLSPIREFFGRDCAYVLVIPRDEIKPQSLRQQAFRQMGGIIVPLYCDYAAFRSFEVPKVIRRYDLHAPVRPLRQIPAKRHAKRSRPQANKDGDLWLWDITKP